MKEKGKADRGDAERSDSNFAGWQAQLKIATSGKGLFLFAGCLVGAVWLVAFMSRPVSNSSDLADAEYSATVTRIQRLEVQKLLAPQEIRKNPRAFGEIDAELDRLRTRARILEPAYKASTERYRTQQALAEAQLEADAILRQEQRNRENARREQQAADAERDRLESLARSIAARCHETKDKRIADLTVSDTEYLREHCGVTNLR